MNTPTKHCSRCRAPLGRDMGGGVCTACLLEEAIPAAEGFAATPADHDLAGDTALVQHFGPYELLEEIGRGGMGVIYRARHPGLDRVVALKMLLAGEFADAKARERLLREAKIAARLSHPGIVTIYDVGQHSGRPYFAMEYVPGRNLAQHCRDGLLPVATAVRYLEHLALAVHYAHQHGVIHRDLKPANVLIGPDDEPKLSDFGLTKSLVDSTRTIESAGSPNFMAPEQADSSLGTTGTATDIFGLGAILYYLLTGRPPAVGETLSETLRNVVASEPVPPRQFRPAVPGDLETIALKCLEKEPSRRYGSALEVAQELSRWQRHEPILARPPTGGERLSKWVRRHPVVAALTASVALSLFGGLGATSWQARRANRASVEARAAELTARRNAYAAEMTLANQSADKGEWHRVRTILGRTRPAAGELDLRSWEWRYLWNISRLGADGRFGRTTNKIWSMAALDDGRTVALGEVEGGFSLWDAQAGKQLYRLPKPINRMRHPTAWGGSPIMCRVATVPDSGLLAYTECRSPTNGFVHLWDIARRQVVRSLPLPGMPRHLAASPDGRRVACSLMWPDTRTLVLETASGQLVATLESSLSSYSACNTLAFSADGRALSLEDDKARCIRVVEIATGRDLHRFPLEQDYPLTAAFSPDGRWLVTGGGFNPSPRVLVWDLQTGERKLELPASSQFALHFDATGRRLVTGLSIWRVPEFTLEREFDGMDAHVKAALLLADGDILVTEDGESGAVRWKLSSPPPDRGGHALSRTTMGGDFLPQGAGMLTVRTNGTVDRAVAPRFQSELIPALGADVVALGFVRGGKQLAVSRTDGSLSLHSPDTFAELARFPGSTNRLFGMVWVAKAGLLALVTADHWIEAWDLESRARRWNVALLIDRQLTPPTPDGILWQLQPDGRLFGYDVVRREVVTRQLGHDGMHRLAFSSDGRLLLTTEPNGAKRLVETQNWRTLHRFESLDLPSLHGGAFWPNESRLTFTGPHIVDLNTGRALLNLKADFEFAANTAISPDGSTLLVTGETDRVFVWWAPSWDEIRRAEAADASAGW